MHTKFFFGLIASMTIGFSSASQALINGVDRAVRGESATVALLNVDNDFLCTGAIINEEWILTVADNKCRSAQTIRIDSEKWNANGNLININQTSAVFNYDNTLLLYKLVSSIPVGPTLRHERIPLLAPRSDSAISYRAELFELDALTLEGWGKRCNPCETSDSLLTASATISEGASVSFIDFINNGNDPDAYFSTIPINFTVIDPSPIVPSTDTGTLIFVNTPFRTSHEKSLIGFYSSDNFTGVDNQFKTFTPDDLTWINTTTSQ
ncbi:trypsin-like serine protease [Microbulbifer sp. TYP-18]|uniref:trypsin-like serine protease n=1 Tax=Microbulbifer sp. TYP-18 TaxID=3230024 RepID=UPI0034C65161